ncbi:MAG: hypothetical protein M3Z41_08330 [Candidatus Eremiobacteraeota bacterium]|nr:hypothetical protein [Candidatus Eremiobacteraeota bacterium]
MAPLSLGSRLRLRAREGSRRIFQHTRRRFARARVLVRRRTLPAFALLARVRKAA